MDYIVDVENKRLVSSFRSTRTTTPESAVFGDTPSISVRLVEPNVSGSDYPWRYVDLNGYTIRVAIGRPGGDPITGTFTLTFDGDTTTDLAAGATAAQVDAALNALTSITSAGGVTVTSAAVGQYQIAFDSVGARNIITANTDALYPASSAYIYEATAGDVSTKEVQIATIEVDNAAYVELTTNIAAPAATVTTVREGVTDTTSELQRIEISGDPYLGTFAISINGNTSSAISIDATIDELTTAIEGISGIGAGNVVVTGSITDFTIQFASSLGNVAEATVDVANLTGSVGKTGSLDLNTNQFLELLNGEAQTTATLEIVKFKTVGSTSETILQAPIVCKEDVIADTPVSTTPFPSYAAASHQHVVADLTDLASSDITLNTDSNLAGNAWFLDDDTMAANDAQKVASQQSVKAYVDTQIAGLGVDGFTWQFDSTTTQADPGSGIFRLNNATAASVTVIYIDDFAQNGLNASAFFRDYPDGGYVFIEDKSGNALLYKINTISELTGYFALTVTWEDGTTMLTNSDVCFFRFLPSSANVTGPAVSTDNAIVRWDGTTGRLIQNTATATIDDSGNITATNISAGATLSGANTGDEATATTTTEGIVELATQAEVDAGTDASRAVTPSTLANYTGLGIANVVEDTTPQLGGSLDVNGNKIVSVSNGNIDIEPNGTGNVLLGNFTFDADQTVGAGQDNYVLTYDNGTGTIGLEAAAGGGLANVVEDTTPQLGGDLDTNGNSIVTLSNNDLNLSPNGTGEIVQTTQGTVQRNGNFSTTGDAQAVSYVLRCQTTSTTPVTFTLDGSSAEMTLSADSTWAFTGLVVARRGTTQDCAGYKIEGLIEYEDGLGSSTLLASTVTAIHEDDAAWNVTVAANGTGLRLQAVGNTGENINWVAHVQTVQTINATQYY